MLRMTGHVDSALVRGRGCTEDTKRRHKKMDSSFTQALHKMDTRGIGPAQAAIGTLDCMVIRVLRPAVALCSFALRDSSSEAT